VIHLSARERRLSEWPRRTLELRGEISSAGDACVVTGACFAPSHRRELIAWLAWSVAASVLVLAAILLSARALGLGDPPSTLVNTLVFLSIPVSLVRRQRQLARAARALTEQITDALRPRVPT